MKRLAPLALLAVLLLPACGHNDRPEGTAERFLNSLNQGAAGRPERFAPLRVANSVLPGWEHCTPGVFDMIEVGAGSEFTPDDTIETKYAVPYRLQLASDAADRCGHRVRLGVPRRGNVIFQFPSQDFPRLSAPRLLGLFLSDGNRLPLPSERGPRVARASSSVWLAGVAVGLVLCGLVALLMRAMPRPAPLSSEPLDPQEARGL